MGVRDRLLEFPLVYAAWQAPFAAEKFAPVARWLEGRQLGRVLDLGCGAGTNAARFARADYVGIDVNERYLRRARARFRGAFVHADLTASDLSALGSFDMVLINSFLHHVGDADVERILGRAVRALAPGGTVHVLELVLPPDRSLSRLMARLDRGRYARPFDRWREMFEAAFEPEATEAYVVGGSLWSMIYCRGRRRS